MTEGSKEVGDLTCGSLFRFKDESLGEYKNVVVGMDDLEIYYVNARSTDTETLRRVARNVIFFRMPTVSFGGECEVTSSICSQLVSEIFYTELPTRLLQSQNLNWGEGINEVDGKRLWGGGEALFDLETVKCIDKVYLYPFDGGRRDFRAPKLVEGGSCVFEPISLIDSVLKVQSDFENAKGHSPLSFGVGLYRAGCYKNRPSYLIGEFLDGEAMLKKTLNRGQQSL